MKWLLVAAGVALALLVVDRAVARRAAGGGARWAARRRTRVPRPSGGSGALGELVEVFQPSHQHLVAEQERRRNEVQQAGSAGPGLGVDLDAGVVTLAAPGRLPGASPGRAAPSVPGSTDMTVRSELFVADHAGALARADARDARREPAAGIAAIGLAGVGALDLEVLGEVAARAVQFGTGDLELQEVDLDRESLFELPPFLRDVLVELGRAEDRELPAEVGAEWAADEDLGLAPSAALPLVTAIVDLVTAAAEAPEAGRNVYLWVGSAAASAPTPAP